MLAAGAALLASSPSFAAAPALRDELDLSGTWTQGGAVPQIQGNRSAFTTKTFERSITIPAAWTGKKIFLELEAFSYGDVTSINGTQVGTSTGGWFPHSYDITSTVTPGQTYTLDIVANGNKPAGWPTSIPNDNFSDIIYPVFLRAYGMVAIRDAEVVTSVTNKTITVNFDVQNFSAAARTVTVNSNIIPSNGGAVALTLPTASASFAAGERKTVQVSSSWTNPDLWWPSAPKLYNLCSAVKESGTTVDSQTVRFGFRECKVSGRNILLNGVRVNFRGESFYPSGSRWPADAAAMRTWINVEKSVNANDLRFHVHPAPHLILDVCDEMGFMVEAEAPLWQATTECASSITKNTWMPNWVKTYRNHASIVHWSAENEGFSSSEADLLALTNIIRSNDHSGRIVWHEWPLRFLPSLGMHNQHYPEGYGPYPYPGLIYDRGWIQSSVPTGCGEYCIALTAADGPPQWSWQGTFARGMRYNDVALIHPYVYLLYAGGTNAPVQKDNLIKSFAPVALFDHAYVGLGIAPLLNNTYPSAAAGSTANRTLDLYNDEFSDSIVTIQVDVKSGGATRATATKSYAVTLGYHIQVPCSFQVPYAGGSTMQLVLSTSKAGASKFTETLNFNVTGASSGTSSSTVTLGGTGVTAAAQSKAGNVVVHRSMVVTRNEMVLRAGGSVSLFDTEGRLAFSARAVRGMVSLSGLHPGNYAARIEQSGRVWPAKVVLLP
jgi:hypothetical protein